MKQVSGKTALFLSMIAILMMSMGTSIVIAQPEPPGGGEHLRGPALIGKVTITSSTIVVTGAQCKGNRLDPIIETNTFGVPETKEDLLDFRVVGGTGLIPECFDFSGDLIIQAAQSFSINNGEATFDVVILGVVAN